MWLTFRVSLSLPVPDLRESEIFEQDDEDLGSADPVVEDTGTPPPLVPPLNCLFITFGTAPLLWSGIAGTSNFIVRSERESPRLSKLAEAIGLLICPVQSFTSSSWLCSCSDPL